MEATAAQTARRIFRGYGADLNFPPIPPSPPPSPPVNPPSSPPRPPLPRCLRGEEGGDEEEDRRQQLRRLKKEEQQRQQQQQQQQEEAVRAKAEQQQQQVRPEPDDPGSGGGTGTFDIQKVVSFPLKVLVDATNTFASGNHLGQGTYGMVYKAKLPSGDVVAVKRAKADRKQDAGKFRKEIELLSRVSHKNLVRLVGYCREGGEQLLVYEYVAGGNLSQNLNPTWRERHSRPPLNWTERLLIAAGTARGLAYLHEEINVPFIHRDVKPSNIMIDRHVVAKIADFGTTKPMTPEELRKMSVTIQGTAGYCDPDYLRTGHSSKRIDVYSLGIVLLELLTGKGPHKVNRPYRFDVKDRFDRGGLPSIVDPTMGLYPADELYHVFDLALRCTDIQNPAARPSMSRVVAELEAVLEPEAISRFISSGPPSHDSADFRTAPSGSGAGPGGAGLTRFAGAGKQVGQGGVEGGPGSAAAGSGVAGLAVGGTAGAALAAAISSASPSRADDASSTHTPDSLNPPNCSQPQLTPPSDAPIPPPSSRRTPGPPAYKGRAAGAAGAAGAAAGAAEATGGDIRGVRDRDYDGAYVVSHDVGVQMKPAPVAAFRGASAAVGGGATGAGVTVAGVAGGNAGGISGGIGVAAPPTGQPYEAGERFGEGGGGDGGERGGEGYEEGLDASFDSSGFDRSGRLRMARDAVFALSLALLLVAARAGSPITSSTANEKPDPSSKKDDGLMTELPADIAKQAASGNAAGLTYVDTAQDSFFMADVKKAGWNAQKCPPGLNKELAGACTPKNCSKGGIAAKWKTAYLQKNKLGYELYVPGNPLTLLKANPASCCNTTEAKPVPLQVRIGGECNPSAKILNDPHLVGAHGTHC
ncbi:unnamed protein product [Closterium sp. Naga37s-1]|nr:unnamed protein product [Closterium sp. Naga37s-1]